MKQPEGSQPMRNAFRGDRLKPTVVLLCSTLLMLTWWYAGSPEFYRNWLSKRLVLCSDPATAAAVYHFGACLLLLGAVPLLIVKLVLGERLADYGIRLGDRVRTVRSFLLLAPGCVLAGYLASCDPATRQLYPINASAGNSPTMFAQHACSELGDRAALDGAKALAMTALDFFCDEDLRSEAREAFEGLEPTTAR